MPVGDLTRIAPDGAKITANIAKNQVTGVANANQAPSSSRIDFGPVFDVVQTILDAAGLVPGIGEAADLIIVNQNNITRQQAGNVIQFEYGIQHRF